MDLNISTLVLRAKHVVSSLMNVPESDLRVLKAEFRDQEVVIFLTSGSRKFKVTLSIDGVIKTVEEVQSDLIPDFCVDERSAIVLVLSRYPDAILESIERVSRGYKITIRKNGKVQTLFVSCNGKVRKESLEAVLQSISGFYGKIVSMITRRTQ